MHQELPQIVQYIKKRRRRKLWQKIVRVMACCVIFCTVYALILPAITQELPTFCGMEAHTHDDSCYQGETSAQEKRLICSADSLNLHVHTHACMDAEGKLVCGLTDYVLHQHDNSCVDAQGNIICTLPEIAAHVHTDACYEILSEGHIHSAECFETERLNLICQMEEMEGHTHGEACYVPGEVPECGLEETEGHVHGEACYTLSEQLQCQLPETQGHSHGEGCYELTLQQVCQDASEDHVHTDACYQSEKKLVCTQEESAPHTHGAECFASARQLTCQKPETQPHVHDANCYSQVLICEQGEVEGHIHEDACYECIERIICGQEEIAAERNLICTVPLEPVHVHSDGCFETVTTENIGCLLEENEEHTHSEQCTGGKTLVCSLEEHEHELICYSDATADLETASDWEASIAKADLTGIWSKDILTIAETQLGCQESTRNYIVLEDGETIKGITRYGQWYGVPHGDWCAMFVSFCLNYAQVENFPLECGCTRWIELLDSEEYALYRDAAEYTPVPGDVIFFDWECDGLSDHVGIVAELIPATETDAAKIKTIEGNSGNRVKYVTYEADSPVICGYGAIPDAMGRTQTILTAKIFTDGSYQELAQDDTQITVSGVLPATAEVRAYAVEIQQENLNALCVYDIEIFLEDGTVYVHEGEPLSVNFSSPQIDELCNGLVTPEIYYIPEEGEPEQMDTVVEEGQVSFETPHFSTYALVVPSDPIQVGTQEELVAAWDSLLATGKGTIQLKNDIQVNAETALLLNSENADITVDLNGFTLTHTGTASLFAIQSGKLTVGDSIAVAETVEDMDAVSVDDLAAHTATAVQPDGKVTLTYYITESSVSDADNGATQETLMKHTVTSAGTILANASAPIFTVQGGTLNIDSGMYYGGTERVIYQTGGTANLTGGYIAGFTRAEPAEVSVYGYEKIEQTCGGAVWTSNHSVLNLYGTILAGNKASAGGAVYANASNITIDGGIISGNTSTVTGNNPGNDEWMVHYGGGGIFTRGQSNVTMTSGYITNNLANSVCYFDGGGGVLLGDNSTMTVTGGYLTGNQASSGGAIRTNWKADVVVEINDGYFCANYAKSAEGGAVSINQNAQAVITGGYFNHNRTDNVTHWGGGAIFGANGSQIYMLNVLITDNEAEGFGGGVAGCSTGRVQVLVQQGGAVFNNTAAGDHMSGSESDKREDTLYAYGDPVFMSNGYQDFFCALNSTVDGSMLGDNSANWTGSSDGKPVAVAADEILQSAYVAGLTAHPSDKAILDAQKLAQVYINGNFSNTHGGGILCNGYLLIGEPESVILSSRIELLGSKVLVNEHGDYLETDEGVFKFEITDAYTGEHIAYGSNKQNGTITFDHRLPFNSPGTYTFLIREVPMDNQTITYDTTRYRMTVTVEEFIDTLESKVDDQYDVARHWYQVTNVKIEEFNGESWRELFSNDPGDHDDGAISINLTGGASFTNLQLETTKITVVKQWTGDVPDISVTAELYRNGSVMDTITLNASNNWTHTWENLPLYEKDADGNVINQYSYSVMETPLDGYVTEYDVTNKNNVEEYWIPAYYMANELVLGERYMIVNQTGDYALMVTSNTRNAHFDSNNRQAITKNTESVKYGEHTIPDNYKHSQIEEGCVFRAVEAVTNSSRIKGTALYNSATDSTLLLEKSGDDYLKGSNGLGAGYISLMEYKDQKLYGWHQWYQNELLTVTYETDDSEFDADANDDVQNYAKLYVLVTAGASTETVVTITNTPIEKVLYQLDLTKVSGWDPDVKLAGAIFNLLDAEGNVLTFEKEAEGSYLLSTAEGAQTDLVTNFGGKLVLKDLPEGSYLLKEKQAPTGYLLMEDMEVTLGGESLSLALTLEDMPAGAYELPETGGAGTTSYTMAGFVLMIFSSAFLMYSSKKRRRGEHTS